MGLTWALEAVQLRKELQSEQVCTSLYSELLTSSISIPRPVWSLALKVYSTISSLNSLLQKLDARKRDEYAQRWQGIPLPAPEEPEFSRWAGDNSEEPPEVVS